MRKSLLTLFLFVCSNYVLLGQNSVTFEAESGSPGSEFNTLTQAGVTYITVSTDLVASQNPGTSNRVVTYTVTFPVAGTYDLYARVRVGAGGANDDSYFYGNGFGVKTTTATGTASDADWITVNGLFNVGYTVGADFVLGAGTGGTGVWKWLDMSKFNGGEAPVTFTVPAGNLTQTFQIGGRENGLDFDKLVFGLTGYYYTVTNLNNGEPGTMTPPPPPFVPKGPPLATGKSKVLGGVYSQAQKVNFSAYWNQVTPENAGKWGTVEGTRNVMNWSELDSTYKLAKDSGYPFKMHTLIWGSQQPAWMETLTPDDQLAEIKEWFAAVAQRYPAIDFIEVVNEPLHAPPDQTHSGKYINALGGSGATGWDWIINSFRLARQYFPAAKLWINDYSIVNSTASTAQYLNIINLLKAENLIDGVGEQAHAFTTFGTSLTTMTNNLNTLASAGLPLYATELDIDGPPANTGAGDTLQLNEYKRVFPLFWEHPAIKGITMWGYRQGHWRTAQGAPLVYDNNTEKPAMTWLKQYIQSAVLPVTVRAFEVVKQNSRVTIKWSAANELRNDYYAIERSADGRTYVPLIREKAALAAGDFSKYVAYDDHPARGMNYYRLVQYDKDGRKTYYGVRVVNYSGVDGSFMQVYPNPASDYITIRTAPGAANKGKITITDASGQLVKAVVLTASGVQTILTRDLATGTYLVRLHTGGTTVTSKLMIVK